MVREDRVSDVGGQGTSVNVPGTGGDKQKRMERGV